MTRVDLRFAAPLNTSHPVKLLFNAGDDAVITQVNVTLNASVPAPTCDVRIFGVVQSHLSASVPAPTCDALMYYDNAVNRGVNSQISNAFQNAACVSSVCEMQHEDALKFKHYVESKHNDAAHIDAASRVNIENSVALKRTSKTEWSGAISVMQSSNDRFEKLTAQDRIYVTEYEDAVSIQTESKTSWIDLLRTARPIVSDGWDASISLNKAIESKEQVGKPTTLSLQAKHQTATQPKRGRYVKPVDPVKPDTSYKPSAHLLFGCVWLRDSNIVFGQFRVPTSTKIIPVRRVYTVINSSDLVVAQTGQRIETFSMAMSIDMDSWTWGFNAEIASVELGKVLPIEFGSPVEVIATVNGESFSFIVESTRRGRSFGKESISVSGRGKSAILSDTYSPNKEFTNATARTAQQLMNDVLTNNGVPIGWAVNWQIDDWIVPSGVWSHQGTYMSAITTIANSAGAFVHPHGVSNTLYVKPRNKVKPWEMDAAIADVELPSSVVETDSTSWESRPRYDSIYVSGTTAEGVLGLVRKTGSAGNAQAPMITDPLITHVTAARQRGVSELGRFGPVVRRELTLPVLTETGIIMPGSIIKYNENGISNTGLVNGVRVNVATPSVRQQISITSYE